MDKIIDKIVALGVPGLVLLVALKVVGFAGAAALTTALAALGGPIGMIGGIGLLILLALIAKGISDYSFESIYLGVIKKMKAQGKTKESILREIDGYLISSSLRAKLKAYIRDNWKD